MNRKSIFIIAILCLISLLLSGAGVSAQIPYPPEPTPWPERNNDLPDRIGPGSMNSETPLKNQPLAAPESLHPSVTLGQPGLSFRYVTRYGSSEVAYTDDSTHLNVPCGVGTYGTDVWIAECYGRRAMKYNNTGTFLMQIGQAGFRYVTSTTLDYPTDVAVDSGGNIWVIDPGASHIVKFNSSGIHQSELGELWVSGNDNSHFDWPFSIAFDTNGNIYISDSDNQRIQIFDSTGTYLNTIGVTGVIGVGNNQFNYPEHIVVDGNNLLYVADWGNHRVQIFDVTNPASITYITTLGVSGVAGSDNNHLDNPMGVAVDISNNRIFVADDDNFRVQVFNYATRAYIQTINVSFGVFDVATDTAGNLYVVQDWTVVSRVLQYNSSLVYTRTYGTYGVPYITNDYLYNRPAGVAIATNSSIYIGESAGRRVIK